MTDEDLIEFLETTIDDSFDLGWTSRDAATLIVSRMHQEGLVLIERETVAQQLDRDQRTVHTVAPAVVYRNPDGPAAADEIERLTAEVRRLDYSTVHTCWDECPRVPCAQRREIDALTAQLADARQQASKLWTLLDDIDTLDDACRGEDDLFRALTRTAQQKRHAIMTGDELNAARADPVRGTLGDSDGDDGA